ncbi:MAG: 4a-hydroxytetrahydrobiopterin dehydratase [Thermodesulfobacteriota bacterium]
MDSSVLSKQKCEPCEGGILPLSREEAETYRAELQGVSKLLPGTGSGVGWEISEDGKGLEKVFAFEGKFDWTENYQNGADFVERIVEIAQQEKHHPATISLRARRKGAHVYVKFSTHAIGGLSKNDFIIAAKLSNLFEEW